MKDITISLPDEVYADLETLANRDDRTPADFLVRQIKLMFYGHHVPASPAEMAAIELARAKKIPRINIKAKDRNKIFERDEGHCHHCKGRLVYDQPWHVDHLIPVSKGGTNDPANLVASCVLCNLKKRNKMPETA